MKAAKPSGTNAGVQSCPEINTVVQIAPIQDFYQFQSREHTSPMASNSFLVDWASLTPNSKGKVSASVLSTLQVIVIPIFWNRKPEEKEQVIAAGGYIVNLLETAGIETGIDTTTTLSPGQKFGYW